MVEPSSKFRTKCGPIRRTGNIPCGIAALVVEVENDASKRLIEISQTSDIRQWLTRTRWEYLMSKVYNFFLVVADPFAVKPARVIADRRFK
jgi:hypothetical protein